VNGAGGHPAGGTNGSVGAGVGADVAIGAALPSAGPVGASVGSVGRALQLAVNKLAMIDRVIARRANPDVCTTPKYASPGVTLAPADPAEVGVLERSRIFQPVTEEPIATDVGEQCCSCTEDDRHV
jgi:hypothetical protein